MPPIHERVVLPARPTGGYIPSWFQPANVAAIYGDGAGGVVSESVG